MKKAYATALILLLFQNLLAQDEVNGTWVMDRPDGYEKIVITASPYTMLYSWDTKADTFIRASYLRYKLRDGKLIPTLLLASFKGFREMTTDFRYKVDDDKQRVWGRLFLDGDTLNIDETYSKAGEGQEFDPACAGAWRLNTVGVDSVKMEYLIVNPTRWMEIVELSDGSIEAFGGSHSIHRRQIVFSIDFASAKEKRGQKIVASYEAGSNQLSLKGIGIFKKAP